MGCQEHVSEALRLAAELLALADGDRNGCEHDACMLLDGVIRDCGWRIRHGALQWRLDLEDREARNGRG